MLNLPRRALFSSCALLVCASIAGAQEDGSIPQTGTFGQVAPQSADVRLKDALVHQDDHGGAIQQLVCAAGSPAGFALLWRDHREGMMGLYLGRFGPDGKMREPESPVHQPHAGRRLQPGLVLDGAGNGLALWTNDVLNQPVLYVHSFDGARNWLSVDQPLTPFPDAPRDAGTRAQGVQLPSAAPLEGGGYFVAWTQRGAVMYTETNLDGTPKGELHRLNPRAQAADPGVQLVALGKKGVLALWHADGKLCALSSRNLQAQPRELGAGELVRASVDEQDKVWMLCKLEERGVLRSLKADGSPEKSELEVCAQGEVPLDLARIGARWAVLVQKGGASAAPARGGRGERTASAGAGSTFQIRLFDPAKPGAPEAIDFLSKDAHLTGTPLIASDGTHLLVAWTDEREGDPDVYARLVQPGKDAASVVLSDEFRANTDRASADQNGYRLSCAGELGVVTWLDKRDSKLRAFGRRISAPGAFASDEFPIPAQGDSVPTSPLAPAARADGSFACAWTESGGKLRAQAFDRESHALGAPLELAASGVREPVLLALPADLGWLCVWPDDEPSVWSRRISAQGALLGESQRLSKPAPAPMNNLSAVLLDARRIAIAWDTNDGGWKLRGRFTNLEGAGVGDEFALEASPRKQDWDPALAPADGGGFVVSWTSGAPDDGSRDVVARFYDASVHPVGPILWISPTGNEQDWPDVVRLPDGTWAVAWEDDISGYDHTYLRRIQKGQRELGPIVRINELETKSIEDRVSPRISVLKDGLACVFGDRRRSLGWDVFLRVLGPRFDLVGKH